MIKGIKFLFVRLVFISLLVLTACLPQNPTPQDVIGRWIEQGKTCKGGDSATCGSFEFFSDGHFEARNIPREYFLEHGVNPKRVNASGTWESKRFSNDLFARQRIWLNFGPLEGYPLGYRSEAFISWDVGGFVLFAYKGDPDSERI
jgi:hypothetical protein